MPPAADASTVRLTVILSGAITLGAYEAGVVSQIAYAIEKWNEAQHDKPPLVIIDVVSGASAGAITGGMLAAHIMRGGAAQEFVFNNLGCWSSPETTFENQTTMRPNDKNSILSSTAIQAIADKHFLGPTTDPGRVRQPELIYTCTTTSLTPIPYQYKVLTDLDTHIDRIGSSMRDWVTFSVCPNDQLLELPGESQRDNPNAHPAAWDRIVSFALASAAFPIAWQPLNLSRRSDDYDPPWRGAGDFRLSYVDGGVIDNMPLDRGTGALDNLSDWSPEEVRYYVIIQPDPPGTVSGPPLSPFASPERDATDTPVKILGSIVAAAREQSFERDLYQSQKINVRLRHKEKLLPKILKGYVASLEAGQVQAEEQESLKSLQEFLDESGESENASQFIAAYQNRLKSSGAVSVDLAALPEDRRKIFLTYMAMADEIADLSDKGVIKIASILPAHELSGAKLGHFGGFLDPALTKHDFICGLKGALAWLTTLAQHQNWPSPADAAQQLDIKLSSSEQALADTTWDKFPPELKKKFFDRIRKRTSDFLAEEVHMTFWEKWIEHWALGVIERKLNH